jgi:peptide/nickel transport system substrate-binding protein
MAAVVLAMKGEVPMLNLILAPASRRWTRRARAGLGALVVAVTIALALAACGGSSSSSSTSSATSTSTNTTGAGTVVSGPGGTVSIRSIDDLDTFDPAKTGAPNMAVQALDFAYDRLVYMTPSYQLKPYLASSWVTTPTSVTFHIRSGATCDNGTPVTPAVVANSLRYTLAKSTASPYLSYVTGPGALKSITDNSSAGTVTVTLTKPYNALVTSFATPFPTAIICPKGVSNPKSLSTAPDGSGPYVYDAARSTRGSEYVFTLRKNYNWGPLGWTAHTNGVPQTIIERIATDETTGANLFLTGEVQISPSYGINERRVAASTSAYNYTTSSLQMGSWGVVFNQNSGRVGADPSVRHAAYLALDGPSMIKAAFSNLGVPFTTLTTPNMQCYNPAVGKATPGYDVSLSKRILENDGYKPGSNGVMAKNGKPLQLKMVMWNTTNQLGDFMQSALSKVGISSTVENTDINTWIAALFTTKNYDISVYSYYSSFPNPVIMPAQDASLSINDPTYFSLSQKAEETPAAAQCPAWDTALTRAETAYDVKPIGVSKNVWFGKGWRFAAPVDVIVDPFTLQQTK